ncbi:tonB-system energizer ExbB [Jiella endophytica]|uniref:Biopolymer transport protein ExbB n=1 Tax=Jiella endophytica TaxID=2558362 RepID=A0A4Y8RJV3_9HYPH|nr:tonB-system energizer ExbB [Jiella endophytica]TFF23319.1 tonB-system energizer ExbB [Jiella endophytica]
MRFSKVTIFRPATVSLLLALSVPPLAPALAQSAGDTAAPATQDASPTGGRVAPSEPSAPAAATPAAPETPADTGVPADAAPAGTAAPAATPQSSVGATPPAATESPAASQSADGAAVPAADASAAAGDDDASDVVFQEPRDAKLPHDLSPLGMFLAADWVVKGVMIGLALASLATWTILLVKSFEVASAKWRARSGVRRLARSASLGEALGDERAASRWRGPVGSLARSAEAERQRSAELTAEGIKERVAIGLNRIEANAARSINRGTGILATIGSIAPFVGLFGTVWGIMNSFIGISEANTTNLAVVAPGIAEALLATAIGLVAAIPAVVVYNVFARSIAGYRAILSDGSALVMQHLSRDLERVAAGGRRAAPLAEAAE